MKGAQKHVKPTRKPSAAPPKFPATLFDTTPTVPPKMTQDGSKAGTILPSNIVCRPASCGAGFTHGATIFYPSVAKIIRKRMKQSPGGCCGNGATQLKKNVFKGALRQSFDHQPRHDYFRIIFACLPTPETTDTNEQVLCTVLH